MAAQSRYRCAATLRGHKHDARRRRPVDTTRRSLVDAARGAGQLRRRPAERPHRVRVRVVRRHAQGMGRVDQRVPPDADRAHELSAAPASSRTARRSLVDAARGAGRLCRRPVEGPHRVRVGRRHAQGLGPVERSVPPHADRARVFFFPPPLSAAPASSRTKASIARRRRDGRRSCASPPCRTAASCPGRATARSMCGTTRAVSASGR